MTLPQTTLKRMPLAIIFTFILFVGLFMMAFNVIKIDLRVFPHELHHYPILEAQIRSYIRTACLQWSLFFLSSITVFLGLAQYWLMHHKTALFISAFSVFSGVMNTLALSSIHTNTALATLMITLKIIVHVIPCLYLMINFICYYNTIVDTQKKLHYIAAHDALTGLYSRREFEVMLENAIANSARYQESFVVFVIDIDNFKSINDTLGHALGDEFLKQFSEQLMSLTRNGETLARIGGDEFALIASRLHSPVFVKKLADRLINGLNISYLIQGTWLPTTVSMGISTYPIDGDTPEALLNNADFAMYTAKNSGKNTYRAYNPPYKNLAKNVPTL